MKKRKILHIFGRMNRGGAEMRTLDLMRRLPSGRVTFDFCSLSGRPGVLDEEIRDLGGHVHYCNLKALSFPANFSRLLRTQGFDVVHSHVHYFSGFILMLAHLNRVPGRIAHFRITDDGKPPTFGRKLQTMLMKYMINKYATSILAVGEGAMEQAWGRGWRRDPRCKVIPNGLDTTPFEAAPDPEEVRKEFGFHASCKLVVHAGRMVEQKNHIKLASILGMLLSRQPNVCALIAGEENEKIKNMMTDKFSADKIIERVRFIGVRADIPRIIMGSDLLLFPSLREGLPGVVLESCAAGTPVLASDIPGIQELVGVFSGLRTLSLELPARDWADVAEHMLNIMISPEKRKKDLIFFKETTYSIEQCMVAHMRAWMS